MFTAKSSKSSGDPETMDHGPPPMKKRRPSKKNPNGADQFYADHSAEYEARGRETSTARQVEGHNSTCPKMRDELDKRRSTGKVLAPITVMAGRQVRKMFYDPKCKLCRKMKREADSKRKRSQRHCYSRNERKCHVTKPRNSQRRLKSSYKLERVKINKGCQYFSPYSNKGTSPDLGLGGAEKVTTQMAKEGSLIYFSSLNTEPNNKNNSGPVLSGNNINSEAVFPGNHNTNSGAVLSSSKIKSAEYDNINSRPVLTCNHNNNSVAVSKTSMSRNSKSDVVSGSGHSANPGTSVNSFSSYNSNLSLDHEPMVTS